MEESDPKGLGLVLRGVVGTNKSLLHKALTSRTFEEHSLRLQYPGGGPRPLEAWSRPEWAELEPRDPPGPARHVQALGGRGSTLSQSPFSVRKMSSGFRRTLCVRSTLRRKRSSVSATTTRISAMAKLCPMQFLKEGFK